LNALKPVEKALLQIIDVSGRTVHTKQLESRNVAIAAPASLAHGMYLIRIEGLDKRSLVSEPILIQR